MPFFAVGNEKVEKIDEQRLCNPEILHCRECGSLLTLKETNTVKNNSKTNLIFGHCDRCNTDYLVCIENKKNK